MRRHNKRLITFTILAACVGTICGYWTGFNDGVNDAGDRFVRMMNESNR